VLEFEGPSHYIKDDYHLLGWEQFTPFINYNKQFRHAENVKETSEFLLR